MLNDLEELREQEDRAEHPEEHQQRGQVGHGEAAAAEQVQRQHRLARPQFPADERGHEQRADHQRRQDGDAGPAVVVAADDAEHDAEQADAGQDQARQVEAGRRAAALGEPEPGDRQQRDADRHVQPEDPLPGRALHDGPADQRADGDGQAADGAPGAQGQAAALRGHRRRQQREGQRDHDGGADALHGPGGHQGADAGRHGRGRRPGGEQAEADREQAPAAVPLAQRGPGEQQHGEGEGVGVHRPLQPFERGVQVIPDRRQRGGHHEVVERGHEQRGRGYGEGPRGAVSGGHCFPP